MELRQKSLRDFIADAFAIKDSEITRLTLFRDTLRVRNGAQFVIVSFGLASWSARRSVRERERVANYAWNNLL